MVNAIYAAEPLDEDAAGGAEGSAGLVTLMLAPMTPHLAEELWEMLGHTEGLWTVSWPAINAELGERR